MVFLYGHNGTGKSTIGRYLQNPSGTEFQQCSMSLENRQDFEILVCNTEFSEANFLLNDSVKGIFTLGQSNVTAEQAITTAEKEISILEGNQQKITEVHQNLADSLKAANTNIKTKVFSAKKIMHTQI